VCDDSSFSNEQTMKTYTGYRNLVFFITFAGSLVFHLTQLAAMLVVVIICSPCFLYTRLKHGPDGGKEEEEDKPAEGDNNDDARQPAR
jgi:hypothetical protein